jgi:hypothetical protein
MRETMSAKRTITEDQINSVTRHHSNNCTWYEVPSANTDSTYTIRFQGYTPFCNCANGITNNAPDGCWHKRAVCIAESRYQAIAREERENEAKLAAMRELRAWNRWADKAFEPEAFSLLR